MGKYRTIEFIHGAGPGIFVQLPDTMPIQDRMRLGNLAVAVLLVLLDGKNGGLSTSMGAGLMVALAEGAPPSNANEPYTWQWPTLEGFKYANPEMKDQGFQETVESLIQNLLRSRLRGKQGYTILATMKKDRTVRMTWTCHEGLAKLAEETKQRYLTDLLKRPSIW